MYKPTKFKPSKVSSFIALTFLFTLLISSPLQTFAQTIHLVASIDKTVGEFTWRKNESHIKEFIKHIEEGLDQEIFVYWMTDKSFAPDSVIRLFTYIEKIIDGREDECVLFYYHFGHGKMGADGSINLLFPTTSTSEGSASLGSNEVKNLVNASKARFKISLIDACWNRGIESGPLGDPEPDPRVYKPQLKTFESLFKLPTGYINITSTSPNQSAMYHETLGGVFSYHFFDELLYTLTNTETRNEKNPNWVDMLDIASDSTEEKVRVLSSLKNSDPTIQQPTYFGEIGGKEIGFLPLLDEPPAPPVPTDTGFHKRDSLLIDLISSVNTQAKIVIENHEKIIDRIGRELIKPQSSNGPNSLVVLWQTLFYDLEDPAARFFNDAALGLAVQPRYVSAETLINRWEEMDRLVSSELGDIFFDQDLPIKVKGKRNTYLTTIKVNRVMTFQQKSGPVTKSYWFEYDVIFKVKDRLDHTHKYKEAPLISGIRLLPDIQSAPSPPPGPPRGGGGSRIVEDTLTYLANQKFNRDSKTPVQKFCNYLESISTPKEIDQNEGYNFEGKKDVAEVKRLFTPDASIQVSSLSKPKPRKYLLGEYIIHLNELISRDPAKRKYNEIDMSISDITITQPLKQIEPNLWYGKIRYIQDFRGLVNGQSRPKYADRTEKEAIVYLKLEIDRDGEMIWTYQLGDIVVNSTMPLVAPILPPTSPRH